MKAVVLDRFGTREVLSPVTTSDPIPLSGQVRIRVAACGVNNVDLQIREGSRGKVPLPHILGAEIAGVVDMVGSSSDEAWLSRRVAALPFLSCGKCAFCLAGETNLCETGTTLGRGVPGGYAELVVIPEANLIEIDDYVGFHEAAATTVSGLAAWHALIAKNAIAAGDNVLVVAGASGVGVWAIQIAKSKGARVIATVGRPEKMDRLVELGADQAVLHSKPDWADLVSRWAGPRGIDLAFDAAGAATFSQSLSLVRKGGSFTFCGATTGGDVTLDLIDAFRKELRLIGSTGGTRSELEMLLKEVSSGALVAQIDSVLPLELAGEAHARLEQRSHFGKVILEPCAG